MACMGRFYNRTISLTSSNYCISHCIFHAFQNVRKILHDSKGEIIQHYKWVFTCLAHPLV